MFQKKIGFFALFGEMKEDLRGTKLHHILVHVFGAIYCKIEKNEIFSQNVGSRSV